MYKIINNIQTNWKDFIDKQMDEAYFLKLQAFLNIQNTIIYPKQENVFTAFNFFDIEDTKVVILVQDPYFNENQAHGLAFSVQNNIAPKSLINIFKELENDLNIKRTNPNLSDWAKQGVLLLNTILTVEHKKPLSHKHIGWQNFSINVIKKVNDVCEALVFVLWGNDAKQYKQYINNKKHLIIESSHPSPLSAHVSFFDSKPFSKINYFLGTKNNYNIKW